MLNLLDRNVRLCDGMTRRQWLQIGGIGLGGLTLPGLLQQRAQAGAKAGKAKSVIVLWFTGGVPQHETWDPKPEAPEEIRGPLGQISSRTPGLHVGALMPKTSLLTDKIAVLRTLVTGDNAHSSSGYQMLTGVPHIPLSRENALPGKPNDSPAMNAIVRALRGRDQGLPAAITLPRRIANVGELVWPGQDGGFLGQKHDPWLLTCDPAEKNFTVPGCGLPEDLPSVRLDQRLSLLEQMNHHLDNIARTDQWQRYGLSSEQAIGLITGGKSRAAFHLDQEPDKVRDRYGRTSWGQSVLLARRLIEAGVSLVQVNWPRIEGKENYGGWDTHKAHNDCLKEFLMPMMDQAYSTLLEDLSERGLLDETLVCWVGEFGHTPKFNKNAGRDHWGRVFSISLAGGGIKGGVVFGATDRLAAEPVTEIVRPCDYLATVFHCLGYEPDTMVQDLQGRPIPITRGKVVEQIVA